MMPIYASGEEPVVGDVVTLRGHKPRRPATVIKISADGDTITVRWGDSKNKQLYSTEEMVLVRPAEVG